MKGETVTIQPVILTTARRNYDLVNDIRLAFTGVEGIAPPLVHSDDSDSGAAIATRDAIRRAGRTGGHVLFLEDDVVVDPEGPLRVAASRFPDGVAAISFCDMREVPEFSPSGLYRRGPMGSDGRGWWGNQALLLHRDTVAMCMGADWFADEVEGADGVMVHKATYHDGGRNCSDIRLAVLIDRHGGQRRDYAVHVPSLFKHVGHQSACFPGRSMGERETRNWIADRRRFNVDAILAADELDSVAL